jgi:hypothetical protein
MAEAASHLLNIVQQGVASEVAVCRVTIRVLDTGLEAVVDRVMTLGSSSNPYHPLVSRRERYLLACWIERRADCVLGLKQAISLLASSREDLSSAAPIGDFCKRGAYLEVFPNRPGFFPRFAFAPRPTTCRQGKNPRLSAP